MLHSRKLLVIGAVPPPHHGVTVYMEGILGSNLGEHFEIVHLDTSDHRDLQNLNKLEIQNAFLAIRGIFQLVFLLVYHRPAIVYIPISATFLPYLRDGLLIGCARLFSRAKVVVHLHGGRYFRDEFYDKSSQIVRFFIRTTLDWVDVAIVLSDRLRDVLADLVKKVVVLPNGSNFSFAGPKRDALDSAASGVVVSYLGGLSLQKGILELAEAAKFVIAGNANVRFQIAGAWWERGSHTKERFETFLKDEGLENHVRLVGIVLGKDKESFFSSTDIFVTPSRDEGFPLAILEAMATSCPVVATKDVGAIPDIVKDGVTGILVEKGNSAELARAICRLVNDPKLRRSMGQAGQENFLANYTLDQHVRNLVAILEDVLKADREAVA